MTPKEQEIAIGELEERVDRLRNLYEQYFLGFEKLEPSVSRKDVDRRFAILRKEQIRNTAMRFRFNVVTQKFNTYAMHWVRICRQIEDGTYTRHVRKAKARFGDAREGARGREKDLSIDIDIGDFEDDDVDALLAEANAAAEDFARNGSGAADTVPPPAMPPQPSLGTDKAAMARQLLLATPGTSFVVGGGREVVDDMDSAPPSAAAGAFRERAARGAALPLGAKPRILRKREDAEPPPSSPSTDAAPPSSPDFGPSSARIPSSPSLPGGGQARPRIAPIGTNAAGRVAAHSSGQIPVAHPSSQRSLVAGAGAQGAGRIPAAAPAPAPSSPSAPRTPAAPPAGASSSSRMPVPAPSSVAVPNAPPRSPPGLPSAGRLPAPAPLPPPSDRRLPGAPPAPSRPGVPAGRPAPPPDPGPRPPMPSVGDGGPPSDARASVRPRAPLPLPSQLGRPPAKKE